MELTQNEKRVCVLLFRYRGSTAKLLAKFFYSSKNITNSNEKYIYNLLRKLRVKGLVIMAPVVTDSRNMSIYYLSKKGLEYTKGLLNIDVGQNGNGLLPHSQKTIYWDIPYDYQKPPTKQIDHFLRSLELYLQLEVLNREKIIYSTSHYSSLYYVHNEERQKLRPDATIFVSDKRYAVEIDLNTEWYKQLYEKLQTYKDYYDYCRLYPDKPNAKPIDTILFIVEDNLTDSAYIRRWNTVISIFYAVFGVNYAGLNLIFCSLNEVADVLLFEIDREDYLGDFSDEIHSELINASNVNGIFEFLNTDCAYTDRLYSPILTKVNYMFETRYFSDMLDAVLIWNKYQEYSKVTFEEKEYQLAEHLLYHALFGNRDLPEYLTFNKWEISEKDKNKIELVNMMKVNRRYITGE